MRSLDLNLLTNSLLIEKTAPDLSPIIQEIIDSYDPSAINIIFDHNSSQDFTVRSKVYGADSGGFGAQLRIEYSKQGGASNVDGFFVAGGTFNSGVAEAPIAGDCPECQLIVNGGVIAFGGVNLGRNLGISSATDPAEIFNYDPAYLYIFATAPPGEKSLLGADKGSFQELPP